MTKKTRNARRSKFNDQRISGLNVERWTLDVERLLF